MRTLLLVGVSVAVSACAGVFLGNNLSPDRLTKAALGRWEVVQPQPVGSATGTQRFRSSFYYVYQRPDEPLMITWDTGISCNDSEAKVIRNQLHATIFGPVVLEVRNSGRATITFEDGTVLRLEKNKNAPGATCE